MDEHRFDDMARCLASATSRRRVLASLAGSLLGAISLRGAAAVTCRGAGRRCTSDGQCCSGICDPATRNCTCPSGMTDCRGACKAPPDFQTDPNNCGGCDRRCPRDFCGFGVCTAGVCGYSPDPTAAGHPCDDGDPCTLDDVCQDGICRGTPKVCDPPGICQQPGICNPSSGACDYAFQSADFECRPPSCAAGVATLRATCPGDSASCPPVVTQQCATYVCGADACRTTCSTTEHCVVGHHCDDGQCRPDAGLGVGCNDDGDCISGVCAQGVCCDRACEAPCGLCSTATNGICTPDPSAIFCGQRFEVCCNGTCCAVGEGCVNGTCEAIVCLHVGVTCDPADNQCCALNFTQQMNCEDVPGCGESGAPQCCIPEQAIGGACDDSCDCCGGLACVNGSCTCPELGVFCDVPEQCCQTETTLCHNTPCSVGIHQCCHPIGGSCSFWCDCCGHTSDCRDGRCCVGPLGACDSPEDCCPGRTCHEGICCLPGLDC